jgi:hypothetical protein
LAAYKPDDGLEVLRKRYSREEEAEGQVVTLRNVSPRCLLPWLFSDRERE